MASGGGVAFSAFRKVFPTKGLASTSAEEVAALGKIYRKWDLIAFPFIFAYATACGFAWYGSLQSLARWANRAHEPYLFLLAPKPFGWALPALFLGILSSAIPTHFTMKALLGDRYREYNRWANLRHGFEGRKAFGSLAILVVGGAALFVAAGLSTWASFGDDGIIVGRTCRLTVSTYPYGRVKAIALIDRFRAPNGNLLRRPYHAIRFDDGEIFTTGGFFLEPDGPRDEAIAALVSERSGLPIRHLDLIDEMTP